MERQQLIKYLDAVCDAESAVQACEDIIRGINNEIDALVPPQKPYEPQLLPEPRRDFYRPKDVDMDDFSLFGWLFGWGSALFMFTTFLIAIPVGIVLEQILKSVPDSMVMTLVIVSMAIAAVITLTIGLLIKKKTENKYLLQKQIAAMTAENEYNSAVRENEAENRKRVLKYKQRMQIYNDICSMIIVARKQLQQQLDEQLAKRSEIRSKLHTLYSYNVIYDNCRNLIAVFSIREYLKMGICSELEGPSGAYAQYMQDVRAQRICASIDELRAAVVSSVSQLQSALRAELNEINSNVLRVGDQLHSSISGLNRMLSSYQEIGARFNDEMNLAQAALDRIVNNTNIISHNQYIMNRMQGISAYLA